MENEEIPAPNSIEIPSRFVYLCADWHGGQNCMMYAVASTGNLSLGSIHPLEYNTPNQRYLSIWRDLACDVGHTARQARGRVGFNRLQEFEKYCDEIVAILEKAYGLEDWEP